jgi:thioredoxin reductase
VFADGRLAPEDGEALQAGAVPVDERRVAAVAPGVVVRFTDGEEVAVDALHVPAPMTPRDDLAARLDVATTELPNGTGFADVDRFGVTSVPGVFAAGDAAGAGNVAAALAGGSFAATGLHRTLVAEPRAVDAHA